MWSRGFYWTTIIHNWPTIFLYSLFIGQQLSTIDQQFFSFFFLFSRDGDLDLIYAVTLGGVGDAVPLYIENAILYILAGGECFVQVLFTFHHF